MWENVNSVNKQFSEHSVNKQFSEQTSGKRTPNSEKYINIKVN